MNTTALQALRHSVDEALRIHALSDILERNALVPHFQPIADLRSGDLHGSESLIRGPQGPLHLPDVLFATARSAGRETALEDRCLRLAARHWQRARGHGRLFVNLSAAALVALAGEWGPSGLDRAFAEMGLSASTVVVEITEHERVRDLGALLRHAEMLRSLGLRFALDDFGDGRSSLRLWAELCPEYVKIDKYFVHEAPQNAVKIQTLKGLVRLAETFGTRLVAEGIETAEELRVVRDLGIELGQGWFLGRPEASPVRELSEAARGVLASNQIAVLPELARAAASDITVQRLCRPVPPVATATTHDAVADLFAADASLRALAIVENEQPVGLLNRQGFNDLYARPFFKEVHGRKSCLAFANRSPLLLDRHTTLAGMQAVLTAEDQRYLTDGFIVTEGGRYLGLGSGDQLVRVVTEARIEAARHANPLTFLPGNIPLTEHIERLLDHRADFVAAYADLNAFKPYNDLYGYWRGDEMIRLVARSLLAHCDPKRDFVGHVGGDDFVILFQSADWHARCERILELFNREARALFDDGALSRGGIEAEDRHGVTRFFPLTTLAIGAVPVGPGRFTHAAEVASAAAAAKHQAKLSNAGLAVDGDATGLRPAADAGAAGR